MFADTGAITVAGVDLSRSAAEFEGIAAALPAALAPWVSAIGPVGAEFLTALATALDTSAAQAARLGGDLGGAAGLAMRTAAAYTDAERGADRSIAALGG